MHRTNLRNVDLNLLVITAAVLKERNLTRAATQLHMSQPAVSHALARARELFRDRLLVRSGNEMLLTARGKALAAEIEALLESVRDMLNEGEFDPQQATGKLRLKATEGAVMVVLTSVLADITRAAPRVSVDVSSGMADAYGGLRNGGVDALLDVVGTPLGREFRTQDLFSNTLVGVCSIRRKPRGKRISLKEYSEAAHAAIETGTNVLLERALVAQGVKRTVALSLPGFVTAAAAVAQSDLLLTAPRTLGLKACELFPLQTFELPLNLAPVTLTLVWHERDDGDRLQQWMRTRIIEMGRTIGDL
ncbi:LysR family transcriptional regulator [Pusillimonas caeni]|uniref:LysR family transcriptional regulator n=1 Tax=Pusillimonas caeni TaxID=1348472 RepID=UPI000E59B80E|nr:LysR family transcriptional regulator [Pusillimonas caeni]TFL15634.1 LysR family transcriptional regulator [Pusillimonas caeni]